MKRSSTLCVVAFILGSVYATADLVARMPAGVPQETQNAWANVNFRLTPEFLVGVEYHYGYLQVNDRNRGVNHRLQLTLAFQNEASRPFAAFNWQAPRPRYLANASRGNTRRNRREVFAAAWLEFVGPVNVHLA